MRSQLDACDSRLPGTGVFDIKTRAALPIRLDSLNFQVSRKVFSETSAVVAASRSLIVVISRLFDSAGQMGAPVSTSNSHFYSA